MLHFAVTLLLLREQGGRALGVARTIGSERLRANAIMVIAAYGRGADSSSRRALYEEALPALDPREPEIDATWLKPAIRLLGIERMRAWARSQPTAERRAAATVALLEAVVPAR